MRKFLLGMVAVATAVLTACDPSSTAGVASTARLSGGDDPPTFLTATTATVNTTPVSFWAKAGSDRAGEIFLDGSSNGNGDRLVRLRVKKDAEIILPNGTKLAKGDSVLITMQVTDPVTLSTHFEPAGIQFKGKNVAQLYMWYGHTNAAGSSYESALSIWKQETSTAPWTKVTSVVDTEGDAISAYIPGFTNYVIAY